MKQSINITGSIDTEEYKIKLDKHGLKVPYLVMAITSLIEMAYKAVDEEDKEAVHDVLKEVIENPKAELKKQFQAIEIVDLLESIGLSKEVIKDEKNEKVN